MRPAATPRPEVTEQVTQLRTTRLAILNNFIPPYWKPVFASLSERYPKLRVFVSTPMEPNRAWNVDWQGLDVVLQKTLTLRGKWRHPKGFAEPLFIHLPIDTIAQLGRFQADVVLSAEMGFRTLLALLYRKLHPHTRLLIWAEISESSEQGRGISRHLLRRFFARRADAFIVFGNSGARYVKTFQVPASKIFKIPYATDVDRFGRNPLTRTQQQARRWLFVGQLIERKGLLPFLNVLVRWMSAHPACAIEFVVAGDGPLRDDLQRFVRPANLKLELVGNVSYAEMPRLYADSGVFIFPTLADTWGLVVNEAMASGLPVLGSVYSQAVEMLVSEGENGWTFRPDNAEQTYQAIHRCLNTPPQASQLMRERARASAVRQTPEHVAALIDDAVAACLDPVSLQRRTRVR